ncbi:hypothetical protein IA539_15680 [Gordonia sp. zg691]|uniref:hypothetical protein n=1 Tax=Gordonia jinghuaiqii TaxID=2758710 RepID=UPI0016623067|nr:hypothetical protein [Gordonia jinghuaiqii]MBD0862637.1 hypothetical protein [Gordonia jinghuaiqii]
MRNSNFAEVLAYLLDRFSSTHVEERPNGLRRGYRAGMTFARVCVLDELTTEAVRTDAFFGAAGIRQGRRREFDALQGLEDRLVREGLWAAEADDSEFGEGYRAALAIARDHLELARRMLDIQRPPAGENRPVRSRSRRSAVLVQ